MRPLAFSSNAFKKNTLQETIDALAGIGYRGVELMADLHHAWPPTFDAARRAAIKRQLNDRGLAVSNVNAFTCFVHGDTYHPTFITDDPERLKLRVDHTKACLELAAEFDCRTVSVQPGGPVIGTGLSHEAAAERFAEALHDCLPTARANGVTIAVEPEPGLLVQSADEYSQFKAMYFADEPLVKMNCDIGHLFCVGDDPAAVIRSMPGDIAHVHLEDIGPDHVHQHLTPGQGVIDFAAVFDALDAVKYDGWVTVELYPFVTTAAGTARAAWDALAVGYAMKRYADTSWRAALRVLAWVGIAAVWFPVCLRLTAVVLDRLITPADDLGVQVLRGVGIGLMVWLATTSFAVAVWARLRIGEKLADLINPSTD